MGKLYAYIHIKIRTYLGICTKLTRCAAGFVELIVIPHPPHSNRYIKNCVSLGYQKPQWSHGGRGCQLCQTATAPHVTCCVVAKSPKVVDSSRLRGGKVRPRLTGTTRDGRKPVWAWLADTGLVVSSPLSAGVPIIPLTHHQVRFRFAGPISTAQNNPRMIRAAGAEGEAMRGGERGEGWHLGRRYPQRSRTRGAIPQIRLSAESPPPGETA